MPNINTIQEILLTPGGGTVNLPIFSPVTLYIVKGLSTLTSNWTIQSSGTPVKGIEYRFRYEADVNLNGNTITVFGKTMPSTLSDKNCQITTYYDGSNWDVTFHASMDENGSISFELIEDASFLPLINGGVFTLNNGLNSPMGVNNYNPISQVTTDSDLYVRAVNNSNVLEIIGDVNIKLDETFSVSDIDEVISQLSTGPNDLEDFELPITLVCNDITAALSPVRSHYVQGILYYTASSGSLMLHVKGSEKSTNTIAEYRAHINLKLKYL